MRRLSLLVLLAGGALIPPPAAVAQGDDARYALVHGCFQLSSNTLGRQVASDVGPFRMQPTRLGHYLLYGKGETFLAARSDDTVGAADAPDGAADWKVDGTTNAFRLSLPDAEGKVLVAGGDGELRVVDAARAGADALFSFVAADGCATYPELTTNTSGTPTPAPYSFAPTRGLLEAHLHGMTFTFLGGAVHCGRPWHPFGAPYALVDCPDHQPSGEAAVVENFTTGAYVGRHDVHGWPTFTGWPHHKTYTHEQVYWKWVERAWRGGLRLYVNLLTDNGVLCEVYPLKKTTCDEMDNIRLQLRNMHAMVDYVDAQYGGPGKGFLRIVRDPFEARRAINDGKLAVVLGIETSRTFNCRETNDVPHCDRDAIDRQLDEFYDAGVRQMEIVNKFDNALTGVAGDGGVFGVVTNTGNRYETGHNFAMQTCTGPDAEHEHDKPQVTNAGGPDRDPLVGETLQAALGPDALPFYPPPPHCNARGLTDLGAYLIRRMMEKGMIFDPDHMSVRGRDQALTLLESKRYRGVISSHSWSTPRAEARIAAMGGVITPHEGATTEFVERWRQVRGLPRGRFLFGLGYATDMNGFASQPGPRADNKSPVSYPFTSLDGQVRLDRQTSGEKTFDINVDGVAHFGMYPDVIEDARGLAGDEITGDLLNGAEAYLQMWERATGIADPGCRGAHLGFTARRLGGVPLGAGIEPLLRSAGQPLTREARRWAWCVEGDDKGTNRHARTVAALTPQGTVGLIASNARTHIAKGVHPGTRARRARLRTRAFGKGVRVRSAATGSRAKLVYVLRSGRVRHVALATGEVARTRASLRAYLKLAGLRASGSAARGA
jgi:microsomal dipeptidase-like Zn-dependent dipeptidase